MEIKIDNCTRVISKFEELKKKFNNDYFSSTNSMYTNKEEAEINAIWSCLNELLNILDSACKH